MTLVIVPGRDDREGSGGGLQIGIGAVERMTNAILVQRERIGRAETANVGAGPERLLVDVVSDMQENIDLLRDHVPIGGKPAMFPMLAGREREAHARGLRIDRGCATDGARRSIEVKTVEISACWIEVDRLHMHCVPARRTCGDRTTAHDPAETIVVGDLHTDRSSARQTQRPSPEHEPIRTRIARGDAEHKGIAIGIWLRLHSDGRYRRQEARRSQRQRRPAKQCATRHHQKFPRSCTK